MSDSLPMWGVEESHEPSVMHGATRNTAQVRVYREQAAPIVEGTPTDIAGVWTPSAAVTETGTPVHRAMATLLRAAPIMALMAALGVPVALWVQSDWLIGIAIVVALPLAGYMAVMWMDLSWNSPGSTEAKRISAAYRLKRMELKNSHELRRALVEAWIEHMDGGRNA